MHPTFLAGIVAAWAVAYVALGVFFSVLAWAAQRREGDYLVFAALSLSLAVHSCGIAMAYLAGPDVASWVVANKTSMAGVILAPALFAHFGLEYVGARAHRAQVLVPAYALALLLEIVNATGGMFRFHEARLRTIDVLGVSFAQPGAPLATPGYVFAAMATFLLLLTVALLLRSWIAGRRETLPAVIGAVIVSAAALRDLVAASAGRGVWALPHGFAAFAFGIACTLLLRYARLSSALERSSIELTRRTAELERSHAELEATQAELVHKEQLAAIGEVATVIAHEVRTPLAALGNAASSLQKPHLADEDRATLLAMIGDESARLARLVSDLLRWAKPFELEREPVELVELVVRALEARSLPPDVRVEIAKHDLPTTVQGDPRLLRQVVDNLVDNAVHAMQEGGTLEVRVEQRSVAGMSGLTVAVRDTGRGMPADVLARAKRPFFTTRASGTGLGLAIVDRIVQAHGGRLELDSVPDDGTTAIVFLPQEPPRR